MLIAARPMLAGRPGVRVSFALLVALLAASNDASAAALGSLATSVGLLAALTAIVLMKGWSAHGGAVSLTTASALIALGGGAALLWRVLRNATSLLPIWRSAGRQEGATRSNSMAAGGAISVLSPSIDLPVSLDAGVLTRTLCDHFVRVQDAWDLNDNAALAALTTQQMLHELRSQRCEYAGCNGRTEVLSLQATLLGYERLDAAELVCVEFSGMLRDAAQSDATPFRELWMLERSKQASAPWKLARQQALL